MEVKVVGAMARPLWSEMIASIFSDTDFSKDLKIISNDENDYVKLSFCMAG